MAKEILLPYAQLSHRADAPLGEKHRIVPKSGSTRGAKSDGSPADTLERSDHPAARRKDHHADEPGATTFGWNARHFSQQFRDVRALLFSGALAAMQRRPSVAGGANPGSALQRHYLQPGIFRENRQDRMARGDRCFGDRVRSEGVAVFRNLRQLGEISAGEQPNRDTAKDPAQFPHLVFVSRREENGKQADGV